MCGIVAIVGRKPAASRLVTGLEKLSYRGYDSSGIATLSGGELSRVRRAGKLENLQSAIADGTLSGNLGIGHTRWATHGVPSEANAHPHMYGGVAIVHNGIIENYTELKQELESLGHNFESSTDSEVIAHLLDSLIEKGMSPEDAFSAARKKLHGAYAIAAIFKGHDDLLIVGREGPSPLAIGYGESENYAGSDALALADLTNKIAYLEEGDWVVITQDSVEIRDVNNEVVERDIHEVSLDLSDMSKAGYRHFMEKEIYEQPQRIEETLGSRMTDSGELKLSGIDWKSVDRINFTACGTAYYAGVVARYWFEQIAGIAYDAEIASEFRYRNPPLNAKDLLLVVSQSGETADTVAALEYAKSKGQKIVSVVNVPGSAIDRASDICLYTKAGVEIGVASTKAFTTQLMVLATLALEAAYVKGVITKDELQVKLVELKQVPSIIHNALLQDQSVRKIAKRLAEKTDVLFLGRGINYPMAMEGSLKLKEISYIHAEAYAAGEMKHGPIALLEKDYPVVVVAPHDALSDKTASNIEEAQARGAWIVAISDHLSQKQIKNANFIDIPETTLLQSPFASAAILQLLSYETACFVGTDVDQPRNLAKSVTVE